MAVELTRNNAKKAGVGSKLEVKQQDIAKYKQIDGAITIVNPPYGERMLVLREAEELYKKMGQRLAPSRRTLAISFRHTRSLRAFSARGRTRSASFTTE